MAEAERDYLLFRLYGPLASWGDIAVGEVRSSFERPSKSAVLGLVAAALGIRRQDEEAHRRLAEDYGFAVEVTAYGHPLRDYHTVQRPPQRRGADYRSRREELAALPRDALATSLSYRDYWQDAAYVAALWALTETPPHSLEHIAGALQRPHFSLYLGRKACPPALPLSPQIVRAAGSVEALGRASFPPAEWLDALPEGQRTIYTDEPVGRGEALVRRDVPQSRRRWQFAERIEYRCVQSAKEPRHAG